MKMVGRSKEGMQPQTTPLLEIAMASKRKDSLAISSSTAKKKRSRSTFQTVPTDLPNSGNVNLNSFAANNDAPKVQTSAKDSKPKHKKPTFQSIPTQMSSGQASSSHLQSTILQSTKSGHRSYRKLILYVMNFVFNTSIELGLVHSSTISEPHPSRSTSPIPVLPDIDMENTNTIIEQQQLKVKNTAKVS